MPDPLQQEMDLLLESGLSYELRGIRAFESHDWNGALAFFRKGVELAPGNTALSRSLHHKLGTALYLTGDIQGAKEQFEEVVRNVPPGGFDEAVSKAHYSLGVLLASQGQSQAAVQHLLAAVQAQPNYVEAHVAAADVLRRSGQGEASLEQYRDALKINPRQNTARLGYAMALVQLHGYRDRHGAGGAGQLRAGHYHPAGHRRGRAEGRRRRQHEADGGQPRPLRTAPAMPDPVVR